MADLNPLRLWRRLLSLPNDSKAKTLGMAFAVSMICAVVVSSTAVMLRPLHEAHRARQQQLRLDETLASGAVSGAADTASPAGTMETLIVDLATGLKARDIQPSGFDMRAAAAVVETSMPLSPEEDIAGIGRRPKFAQIHVLRNQHGLELVVLPIYGTGYQSTIFAYLALKGDLRTVASLKIVEHGETPGIGAKIDEPAWQQLWPGKLLADADGQVRLTVARGTASSEYEVDGITGATRTGNGISNMLRFWLGANGYAAVLDKLRTGEL